jgi:hypothetical protein
LPITTGLTISRIGRQRQVDLVVVELTVRRGAHVVLHVARALDVRGDRRAALELVEDDVIGLAHHGGQHVQATPVRHAQDDVLHAQRAAALDDLLHGRDHGLAAIQAEALGPREALVQEALEALGLDQLLQDGDLALLGEHDLLVATLDALLQPGLLGRVGNVHVLDADIAAVGAAQDRQDLADRGGLQTQHEVEEDRTVVVGLGEAVGRRIQLAGVLGGVQAQRVEVGGEVAAHPVGPDHHDGAQAVQRGGADGFGGGAGGLALDRLGDLGFDGGGDAGPLAVKGGEPVGTGGGHALGRPGRVLGGALDLIGLLGQRGEEGVPRGLDRPGVLRPLGVEILNECGVRAVEEGGLGQDLIDDACVVRHRLRLDARPPRPSGGITSSFQT